MCMLPFCKGFLFAYCSAVYIVLSFRFYKCETQSLLEQEGSTHGHQRSGPPLENALAYATIHQVGVIRLPQATKSKPDRPAGDMTQFQFTWAAR